MFGLEFHYGQIVLFHWGLFVGLFGLYILYILGFYGWGYVNDSDTNCWTFFPNESHVDNVGNTMAILLVGGLVAGGLWAAIWPGIFIFGILRMLRKYVRFTKEVTRALKTKSDTTHTHKPSLD